MRWMRLAVWSFTVLGLLVLVSTTVDAGKGGNKGKPPPPSPGGVEELFFFGQPPFVGAGGWCINCWDIYRVNTDGTDLVHLRAGGGSPGPSFTHDGLNVTDLAFSPLGEFITTKTALVDPDTGAIQAQGSELRPVRWTRQRDTLGDLLPYTQQRLARGKGEQRGPIRPDVGYQNSTENLFLVAGDRVAAAIRLTDLQDSWDPDAGADGIWITRDAHYELWIPEQSGVAGLGGLAWILYRYEEKKWDYFPDADPDLGEQIWVSFDPVSELRLLPVDMSKWADGEATPLFGSEVVLAAQWPTHLLSEDGRFAFVNQDDAAYVVEVDFGQGRPHIPAPTASDLIPIVPPRGYLAKAMVRAMNADGTLLAVNLFRDKKSQGEERQFFVASVDLDLGEVLGLTRVDDGLNYENVGYSAAFRPKQP